MFSFRSDNVLLQQFSCESLAGSLVSALEHLALTLLGRSERLEDVGRRTLQTDGGRVDQRIVLECVVVEYGNRLGVAVHDAAERHITRRVELLDAGQQARGLGLDGHVAILECALNGYGSALDLYVSSVGDLRDVQLLSDLRAYLSGITYFPLSRPPWSRQGKRLP